MGDNWWIDPDQMDDDQRKIISLPKSTSYLITGPPGSGKTNLILLRAKYLIRAGLADVLILTFTKPLKEFLIFGCKQYGIDERKVKTLNGWIKETLEYYRIEYETHSDFKKQREENIRKLREIVDKKLYDRKYDSIFLDEAQDILPEEIELISELTDIVFAVGDSGQKIYDGPDGTDSLKSIVHETFPLRFHYRNGTKICQLADELYKGSDNYTPLLQSSRYDENGTPSELFYNKCSSISEQCEIIIERLKLQLTAYPEELLGVICPLKEDLKKIWNILCSSDVYDDCVLQSSEEGYESFDLNNRICVSTINGAKGIEFRALHIAAFENVVRFRDRQKKLSFTAITRAKTTLSIYHSSNLPGYLESAIRSVIPPETDPNLKDLFKDT